MVETVRILDRQEAVDALKAQLVLDPRRTAVVAVDLHRGHLDPTIATMPIPAERARRVVDGAARLLRLARRAGLPVIHVILENRPAPPRRRRERAQPVLARGRAAGVSLTPVGRAVVAATTGPSSPGTQIIPELGPAPGDYVINTKRRLSAFYGTDLEVILRALEVETILLIGVNTNTCVQCTAFDAFNRDLGVVVVADCVDSMYGEDLHLLGLQNIARAFGWVLTVDEVEQKLGAAVGSATPT